MSPISLLNWMLLSTALLGAWWLCYQLALRQERSFGYNRWFLVLGPLLAAGLPLLPLAWPAGWWGTGPAGLSGVAAVMLPAAEAAAGGPGPTMAGPDWHFWLWVLYVAGAGLLLLRLGAGLGRLWWRTRRLAHHTAADYTLVNTHGQLPTSSFGRLIFWDETLPLTPAEARQVLAHELGHVRQGHTYDRLLLELLRVLLWFNPFVHLCARALGLTHEFLADAAALHDASGATPVHAVSYSRLLARQVAARLGFSVPLAHSFSHSQTLRRIAMIQKTNPVRRWKQWLVLPLSGVLLVAVACEKASPPPPPAPLAPPPAGSMIAPPPPPPPLTLAPASSENTPPPPPPPAVYDVVDQMPELPGGGGAGAIVASIQQHLAYPSVRAADQRTGRVFASFIVTDKGDVQAVHIVKGLGAAYDEAVLKAVEQLPKFEPGRKDGKAVNVSYTVPILFATATLPGGENVKIISR